MKAIDVIKLLCIGDLVVIRTWIYNECFEYCDSAEAWNASYRVNANELLDKEIDSMYMEDGKLIIDLV